MTMYGKGFIIGLALFSAVQGAAMAQPSFSDQQEQNIAAREAGLDSQKRSQQEMVRLQEGKQPPNKFELPDETPSFPIRELVLEGRYSERFAWLQRDLNTYTGRSIGVNGINLLMQKLNESLIDKGYITTRVYVQEQDLSQGRLVFMLAAGTVGDIRFASTDTWGTWKNAFPIRPGDILNVRNIEQGLEQMKRLSSQEVDIQIQPSAAPGQSDLVIAVKRGGSWRLITTFDDSGAENTGKLQASTTLSIENMFSINDIFNVTVNKDVERNGLEKGSKAETFYYSVPFGKRTLTVSHNNYSYHQMVHTALLPFEYAGESQSTQFSISQLLHRDQTRKTNLELAVIKKKRRSYLDDTEIRVQRQATTAVKLGLAHRRYLGNTVIDAAIGYQQGVPWLGARPGAIDHLPGEATTLYKMAVADITIDTPFKSGQLQGRHNITIRGQKTNDLLYGSDLFSIGGRYTVRGFDGEQTLAAESGLIIRNEIRLPVTSNSQLYFAVDYGRVQGPSTRYLLGKELVGGAIGVRGGAGHVQYDVFAGWPLKKPDGFQTDKHTYGFQLTVQL